MYAYFRAIWRCRYFWLSLVRVDLRSRYRGSIIGMGWSLLNPIAMTAILCVVFSTLFKQNIYEFAPYVMAGLTFWTFFVNVATDGCDCFFRGEAYIRQYPAPMAIYPLRAVLGRGFHFGLGFLLVIALAVVCQRPLGAAGLLSLLPACVLLLAAGWSLAILMGLATVRFRDAKHISEVAFQALYFLTPIMYPASMITDNHHTLALLLQLNPLVPFVDLLRAPVCDGLPASGQTFLAAGLITLAAAGLAAVALRSQERKVVFHL
jgi:ABC-type polysaccharide/polyol phosphate export permease